MLSERSLVARDRSRDRWWSAGLWAWGAAFVWCCVVTVARARTVARVGDAWLQWWQVAPVLAVAGAVCLIVAGVVSIRTAALCRAELRVLQRRRRRVRAAATAVGAVVLGATLSVVSSLAGETLVTVLEPESADGCVVVVEESRALVSGSGRVGVLSSGAWIPRWQGTYGSDDRYRPFTDGGYELSWRGAEGDLTLVDPSQPTGPQSWRVAC